MDILWTLLINQSVNTSPLHSMINQKLHMKWESQSRARSLITIASSQKERITNSGQGCRNAVGNLVSCWSRYQNRKQTAFELSWELPRGSTVSSPCTCSVCLSFGLQCSPLQSGWDRSTNTFFSYLLLTSSHPATPGCSLFSVANKMWYGKGRCNPHWFPWIHLLCRQAKRSILAHGCTHTLWDRTGTTAAWSVCCTTQAASQHDRATSSGSSALTNKQLWVSLAIQPSASAYQE